MASKKADPNLSRKTHQTKEKAEPAAAKSKSRERQQARENQSANRGSGEGLAGLRRGDGHPTGR
jgi:hypothetical protein